MKRRPVRALAAVLALLSVLFSQLAVAAYACPGADGMRIAVAVEEAPPCDQHPSREAPATPLCAAHCQQGDPPLDHRGVPMPMAAMAALPSSWLAPPAAFDEGNPLPGELPSLLERPTGPPLAVRHCCLRI